MTSKKCSGDQGGGVGKGGAACTECLTRRNRTGTTTVNYVLDLQTGTPQKAALHSLWPNDGKHQ